MHFESEINRQNLVTRSNVIEQSVHELYTSQYYTLAGITLLYYDHILTLPLELRYIWKSKKISLVHILFFLNRYSAFFGYVVIIFFQFDSPENNSPCADFTWFVGILVCITQTIVTVIFTLRCYALYQRNLWVLIWMGAIGIGTIATSVWTITTVQTLNLSFGEAFVFQSCVFVGLKNSLGYKSTLTLSLTFDILAVFLTFWKTYRLSMDYRKVGISSTLVCILMRDGGIYFLVLVSVNLFNLISVVESSRWEGTYAQMGTGINSVLTHVISASMVSRLVLNLMEVSFVDINNAPQDTSTHLSGWAAHIGTQDNVNTGSMTTMITDSDSEMSHEYTTSNYTMTQSEIEEQEIQPGDRSGIVV